MLQIRLTIVTLPQRCVGLLLSVSSLLVVGIWTTHSPRQCSDGETKLDNSTKEVRLGPEHGVFTRHVENKQTCRCYTDDDAGRLPIQFVHSFTVSSQPTWLPWTVRGRVGQKNLTAHDRFNSVLYSRPNALMSYDSIPSIVELSTTQTVHLVKCWVRMRSCYSRWLLLSVLPKHTVTSGVLQLNNRPTRLVYHTRPIIPIYQTWPFHLYHMQLDKIRVNSVCFVLC